MKTSDLTFSRPIDWLISWSSDMMRRSDHLINWSSCVDRIWSVPVQLQPLPCLWSTAELLHINKLPPHHYSKLNHGSTSLFVQIIKCISPNCKIYLFKFRSTAELPHINKLPPHHYSNLLASSSHYFHSLLLSVFRKEPTIEQDSLWDND